MPSALMHTYDRLDLAFERGEGAYLIATNGRRYLDFGAGVAVNALGHCHPKLVAALQEQATRLWHCSNLYRIASQERLAERLIAASFADAAFFCNSGAEAIECGLKLCRKYHDNTGHPERYRVICFDGGFHGRTLATIAAGSSDKHRAGFDPAMPGFDHVAFGDIAAVEAAITDETAAILIEPVQGEGGIRVAEADFLRALRRLADQHGLLLFFDEVQCGMGRTGRLFAHEWSGVFPDVMALAKGLGGGFPVGACLAAGQAAETFGPGSHGSTFGGNPLAMAVANAVLDVMVDGEFLKHVRTTGEHLRSRLEMLAKGFPGVIADVRGLGLMQGLKCSVDNRALVAHLASQGMLAVPASDNVVRLLPPLIIGEEQIDEAMRALEQSCTRFAHKAA